MRVQALED
jgi:DNA excision repair protein ERCC-2